MDAHPYIPPSLRNIELLDSVWECVYMGKVTSDKRVAGFLPFLPIPEPLLFPHYAFSYSARIASVPKFCLDPLSNPIWRPCFYAGWHPRAEHEPLRLVLGRRGRGRLLSPGSGRGPEPR